MELNMCSWDFGGQAPLFGVRARRAQSCCLRACEWRVGVAFIRFVLEYPNFVCVLWCPTVPEYA